MWKSCGRRAEDLEHIMHHSDSAQQVEWCEVELPASTVDPPPCVKLHGLIPAPKPQLLLVLLCMNLLWLPDTRCRVSYYIDIGESDWLPLPGLKHLVNRAEPLATDG
eukprot:6477000-Amphidinium_carterae.2